ncbi:MAG: DUF1820 family protein [Spirochaeta sp.]
MSIYKIDFLYKEKQYSLKAHELDMTHPYFVSLTRIILPQEKVIIDPHTEEIRKLFGNTEQLMIPLQNVELIEILRQDPDTKTETKLRSFPVVSDSE